MYEGLRRIRVKTSNKSLYFTWNYGNNIDDDNNDYNNNNPNNNNNNER